MQCVATARAYRAALDRKFRPADRANWNGRKPRQGGAAKGTGGGEQGATQTIDWTSKHANHGAPPHCPRWRNVGDAKAGVAREDTPHSRARALRAALCAKYTAEWKKRSTAGCRSQDSACGGAGTAALWKRLPPLRMRAGRLARRGVRKRRPCRLPPAAGSRLSTRTRPAPPATA